MAPINKNAAKSNVKQQAKSVKATNYSTKLRSATVVTPSKDNNSKKNGNLHQAENMESNKNQVRIFKYQTMYVKLSYIFYVYSTFLGSWTSFVLEVTVLYRYIIYLGFYEFWPF